MSCLILLLLAGCAGTTSDGSASGSGSSTGSGSTTGSNPDAGCTAANCDILSSCHLTIVGEPRALPVCGVFGDQIDSYCVEACEANDSGDLLDCIATQFGAACTSSQPPTFAAIAAACVGDAGPCGTNCTSCRSSCQTAWVGCNFGCGDAGVCLDCEYQCSQTQVSCNGLCPTD